MNADSPLTVLLVHNRYREPGGEDAAFEAEARLLEESGHRVVRHEVHNDQVEQLGLARVGARAVWSSEAHRTVTRLAAQLRPDVAHIHNTFPLLSPAVHYALSGAGAAVVQTLHNYRLLCPQGMLLREGRPCEVCVGQTPPWPGVVHACYRGSRVATSAVAAMLTVHRALGTWGRKVAAFIALSHFARNRFVEGGLPVDRLYVKPNFVASDPGQGSHEGDFFLYVGRLSPEKGIATLLEAWSAFTAASDGAPAVSLIVLGDGPLAPVVADAARTLPGLHWEGRQPRERVLERMRAARALVFPSICYENFPTVIAEAYACGLPVLGSRLGSTAELIRDGETGRLFKPGNPVDLAEAIGWAARADADLRQLGRAARNEYEERYTAAVNIRLLNAIYAAARLRAGRRGRASRPGG